MYKINSDNLPLDIREYLMRGDNDAAINQLHSAYKIDKQTAITMIEKYKESLRERKLELDIKMMNEENSGKFTTDTTTFVWVSRLFIVVFAIILIYLMMSEI